MQVKNPFSKERKVLAIMIGLYCRGCHGPEKALCPDCEELLAYACMKLDICPFDQEKPDCSDCHIHCYEDAMRERIRQVMRYAGPRMIFYHPLLAINHVLRRRAALKKVIS